LKALRIWERLKVSNKERALATVPPEGAELEGVC
jgi:hypothetical protein